MDQIDPENLIYLVVLLCAIAFWFVASNRQSLSKLVQQALIWGLIFVGFIAAFGMWEDIRGSGLPQQSVFEETGRIELPRQRDGHYYLTAQVNGVDTLFVVDTGATSVVLTREAAAAAGIDPDRLRYGQIAQTANGPVRTADVVLDSLAVGPFEQRGFRAVVNQGEMPESLLGMTYLQRFNRIEISGGKLVLEP